MGQDGARCHAATRREGAATRRTSRVPWYTEGAEADWQPYASKLALPLQGGTTESQALALVVVWFMVPAGKK